MSIVVIQGSEQPPLIFNFSFRGERQARLA